MGNKTDTIELIKIIPYAQDESIYDSDASKCFKGSIWKKYNTGVKGI